MGLQSSGSISLQEIATEHDSTLVGTWEIDEYKANIGHTPYKPLLTGGQSFEDFYDSAKIYQTYTYGSEATDLAVFNTSGDSFSSGSRQAAIDLQVLPVYVGGDNERFRFVINVRRATTISPLSCTLTGLGTLSTAYVETTRTDVYNAFPTPTVPFALNNMSLVWEVESYTLYGNPLIGFVLQNLSGSTYHPTNSGDDISMTTNQTIGKRFTVTGSVSGLQYSGGRRVYVKIFANNKSVYIGRIGIQLQITQGSGTPP